ncbi:hypothetical protein LSUB1_G007304 [Lachnellula subtilissima]|uniref:Uncharacterized protein n=1 Tax=Lachnellula subtilissima TaxID=602034 RepID=A0A8H8RFJ7_9HELO|nr:hypothetical protein LSUB1_G007304 [Lachnellula subtilissima]
MPALIIKSPHSPPTRPPIPHHLPIRLHLPPTKPTLAINPQHFPLTPPDWDASWQENCSDARFVTQVNWELDGLERADIVVVYFAPEAKAPITLLELGLVLGKGKRVVVCCEEGFWKRGNVELLCGRMGGAVYGKFGRGE